MIPASSASISGAAACAIRRAASAKARSTWKPRLLIRLLSSHSACSAADSGGSRSIQLALDFDVLPAIVHKADRAVPDHQTNKRRPGSSSLRGRRGFDVWCISRSPADILSDGQAPARRLRRRAAPAIRPPAPSPWCIGGARAGSAASRNAARGRAFDRGLEVIAMCSNIQARIIGGFEKLRRHRIAG